LVFNNKGMKEGEKKNNNTFWRRVSSMQRGWVLDNNSLSAISFFFNVVNCIPSKQRENWHEKLHKQTLKVKMVRTIQALVNSKWFKLLLV
jgi:hypothetical protein